MGRLDLMCDAFQARLFTYRSIAHANPLCSSVAHTSYVSVPHRHMRMMQHTHATFIDTFPYAEKLLPVCVPCKWHMQMS